MITRLTTSFEYTLFDPFVAMMVRYILLTVFDSDHPGQNYRIAIKSFPVENVHPANRLGIAYSAQIKLGRLQILMP